MKKILTILSTIGIASIISGCSSMEVKKENFVTNFNAFQNSFERLSSIESANTITQKTLNKYSLRVEPSLELEPTSNMQNKVKNFSNEINTEQVVNETINQDISMSEPIMDIVKNTVTTTSPESVENNDNGTKINESVFENEKLEKETDEVVEVDENQSLDVEEQFSTLYNLTADIDDSCDEFCKLKQQLTDAIIETENLIEKIQNNEIELTREQRMFINEQSLQLKNLGRNLSNITTELSISLSDLNQILLDNGHNMDDLNLKYLIVLDNLINGNEMLQSGLSSINLINQMFNLKPAIGGNNPNRILYGFKNHNEPPVYKNYQLDENGNLIENDVKDNLSDDERNLTTYEMSKENKNIDTFNSNLLPTNVDGYYNNINNIDSFFNTALLDNQFMYGNRVGNPYNNMYYGFNPNADNRPHTTTDGVDDKHNTKHVDGNEETVKHEKKLPFKKKIKLIKNIDTYKDVNEPTLQQKFAKMKSFFKFNSNSD